MESLPEHQSNQDCLDWRLGDGAPVTSVKYCVHYLVHLPVGLFTASRDSLWKARLKNLM